MTEEKKEEVKAEEPKEVPEISMEPTQFIMACACTHVHLMLKENDGSEITMEMIMEAVNAGLGEGIKLTEHGLYALNVQEAQFVEAVRQARGQLSADMELKLVGVPKANDAGIIDPGTGKAAVKRDKKIILAK